MIAPGLAAALGKGSRPTRHEGGRGLLLQRKCACGAAAGPAGDCQKCRHKRLQRAPAGKRGVEQVPASVHEVLATPGRPLDPDARQFFEYRLGHDFSRVRIHDDSAASASAGDVAAMAYTVGDHLVFSAGAYAPHNSAGRGLLAHELTHVIQQSGSRPQLSQLALDTPGEGAQEREAERVRHAVESGAPVGEIGASSADRIVRRLPGSPAGGCGVCYGSPKNAGTAAHSIIQAAFNPLVNTEFALLPSPSDDNGRLDLARFTGPNSVQIGEIKPANPAGLFQGDLDLFFYEEQLQKLGFKVSRMVLPPPVQALDFPSLAPPPCPPIQELFVEPPVHGIYTYWCLPDFAQLIPECPCRPTQRKREKEKEKEREREKEKEKERDKDKDKEKDKDDDKEKERDRIRGPGPEILVPIALAALLGWAAKQAAKQGGKKILAPAYVIAAIVLVANGAEASVGLEGDDALEAMFKATADKGAPLPDDLKQAIKNDPALKKLALDAAKGGGGSEAQRKLGEQLARVITENRDQFSEEDINELLKVSEKNRDAIPNGPITVEALKRALAAKRAGSSGGTPGAGGDGGDTPPSQTPQKEGPPLPAPAKRLQDAMIDPKGEGPKFNKAELEQLRDILRGQDPPLTEGEVDALLRKVASAKGKSPSEVLDSVRGGIADLRAPAPASGDKKAPGASDASASSPASDQQGKGQQSGGGTGVFPAPIETDEKKKPKPDAADKSQGEVYAKVIEKQKQRFSFLAEGEAVLLSDSKKFVKVGAAYPGFLVARNNGLICLGSVTVTLKQKVSDNEWVMHLRGGSKLYGENGALISVTVETDVHLKSIGK